MNNKRTILHVDDDPQITRIVGARLKALGYDVTSVNDARLVLEELSRSHQKLVLLDIDMPHVDGLELLRQIKTSNGGTQVIMLTGLTNVQTALQSFRWGAEFCLFKPIGDLRPLLEAVERTFWKIDQWWSVLQHISQAKRTVQSDEYQPKELSGSVRSRVRQ